MKKGGACSRIPLTTGCDTAQERLWPSCYGHQTEAEREEYLALRRHARESQERAVTQDPACWSWLVPSTLPDPGIPEDVSEQTAARLLASYEDLETRQGVQLENWQDRRCAICGRVSAGLVEDHDHQSGLVRGWLCHGCNVQEGSSHWQSRTDTTFAKYRQRPPTTILGLRVRYWDPVLQDFAPEMPPPPSVAQRRAENPWLMVQAKRRKESA
ncbi:endonuclease domain-containing protein [Streptomyces sp. LN500]|uniref:endonuclease domain-containing protein n=1 Tax=Streptomyces sp. LN500 TaxID=3112978 RepID=UPI00370FB102